MIKRETLELLPKATCYRAHLDVADAHKGVYGAVWAADVIRALEPLSAIVQDCIYALRNQPEASREDIAEILERYFTVPDRAADPFDPEEWYTRGMRPPARFR